LNLTLLDNSKFDVTIKQEAAYTFTSCFLVFFKKPSEQTQFIIQLFEEKEKNEGIKFLLSNLLGELANYCGVSGILCDDKCYIERFVTTPSSTTSSSKTTTSSQQSTTSQSATTQLQQIKSMINEKKAIDYPPLSVNPYAKDMIQVLIDSLSEIGSSNNKINWR
jgi:hypothetical protein